MNQINEMFLPEVTVCVPIYGVEQYIERCAVCLFEQTYANLSFVFVNDCTKDHSIEILQQVMQRYPMRASKVNIIHHEKNRGLAAARNTAVAAVKSPFMFNLDSDDSIDVHTIERLVQKQIETDADVVTASVVRQLPGGKERITRFSDITTSENWCCKLLAREVPVSVWGRLIRTSLYHDNHIYAKEGVNMCEDYHVIPRIAYVAKSMTYENEAIYYYNCQNVQSVSQLISEPKFDQQFECLDILYDFFKDKGKQFIRAYEIGNAKMLGEITMNCCRAGKQDYFKKQIQKRLEAVDKQYINGISLSYRIAFYLPYYQFLHLYASVGHWIKKNK